MVSKPAMFPSELAILAIRQSFKQKKRCTSPVANQQRRRFSSQTPLPISTRRSGVSLQRARLLPGSLPQPLGAAAFGFGFFFSLPVKASEKELLVAITQLHPFFYMDSNYREIPGKTGLLVSQ